MAKAPAMPRPQAPAPAQRSIQDTFQELGDWYLAFRRATAGYMRLAAPLDPQTRAALPIIELKSSADGHSAETVMIDLSKLDPTQLPHVLVPLAQHLRGQVLEATEEIALRVEEIRQSFLVMSEPNAPNT